MDLVSMNILVNAFIEFHEHHSTIHGHCQCRLHPDILELLENYSSAPSRSSRLNATNGRELRKQPQPCQIIAYQPTAKRITRPKVDVWLTAAEQLVKDTPKGLQWWKCLHDRGLYDEHEPGSVLQLILDSNPTTDSMQPTTSVDDSQYLLGAVHAYAKSTLAAYAKSTLLATRVLNVQKLILLNVCSVLKEAGYNEEQLMDITRIIFGNAKMQRNYIMRLWRIPRFLNELVDELDVKGWNERASEMLLIWNRPPGFYLPLVQTKEMPKAFLLEKLSSDKYVRGVERRLGWTKTFIPLIVHKILREQISIGRISFYLGYKHNEVLNPWEFFISED